MSTLSPILQKLEWHAVLPQERARYESVAQIENTRSADYAFANLYLWDETYHQHIAYVNERAVIRFANEDGTHRYSFPIGDGPLAPVLELLAHEAKAEGVPLTLVGVTEPQKEQALAVCPDFEVRETRDYFDYLYPAEALATLSGKKLHGKRNHVNAFCAAHSFEVRALTPADFPACREILAQWDAQREGETVSAEHRAILRAFEAFDALALAGALLVADGTAVAFTVGGRITPDTFCVHFEKALPAWQSAYPVINREFVRMVLARDPAIAFINREDDMGLPNLRQAKLSYRPAELVAKYALQAP